MFFNRAGEEKQELARENRERDFVSKETLVNSAMQDNVYSIKDKANNDLTRWQQDLQEDVLKIVHDLKREIEVNGEWIPQRIFLGHDENGQEVWDEIPPMMNDLGIRDFIAEIRSHTSKNLMMSNYDKDRIYVKLNATVTNFIFLVAMKAPYWELQKKDLSHVVQIFKSHIEPTYWRAFNNGERNYLNSTTKRVEAFNSNVREEPNKWGWFGG